MNLLLNARDALVGTSAPRIEVIVERKDNVPSIERGEPNRAYIRVCVKDNGPGMDDATGKRVFEPFFTTKSPDQGTGLGLSVSYFIITENHNGKLSVESTPGQGAKFIMQLPLKRA